MISISRYLLNCSTIEFASAYGGRDEEVCGIVVVVIVVIVEDDVLDLFLEKFDGLNLRDDVCLTENNFLSDGEEEDRIVEVIIVVVKLPASDSFFIEIGSSIESSRARRTIRSCQSMQHKTLTKISV